MECSAAGPLVALVTIRLAIVHPKDATYTRQRECDLVIRSGEPLVPLDLKP
jgi:hypothetical protein